MVFWCLLTQKSTDSVSFFSTTFGELFLVYSLGKYTRFLVTHPLLAWGWGQKLAKFAVFLVAKILKMHIFLTFLNGYIHPNNFKNKNKPGGFAPNPTHLRGRRGRWQTLSTYPYGECWVDSKASRVKCTTSSPLTPLHLRGGSKTNRSGRSWKPVKACEATA